jgi:hypothetical protein
METETRFERMEGRDKQLHRMYLATGLRRAWHTKLCQDYLNVNAKGTHL